MAKIIMGAFVTEIRGKLAGLTFSRNKAGKYIQNQPTRINRRTFSQLNARNVLARVSQQWGGLTEAQRQTWITASECTDLDRNCTTDAGISGQNLYVRANVNLTSINEVEITEPQLLTIIKGFTALAADADTGGGELNVIFEPAISADVKIIISATPGMRPGKSSAKNKFKKIIVLDSTDISPVDIATEYIAVFGSLPKVGSKLFIQSKPISKTSGRAGTLLRNVDIAA